MGTRKENVFCQSRMVPQLRELGYLPPTRIFEVLFMAEGEVTLIPLRNLASKIYIFGAPFLRLLFFYFTHSVKKLSEMDFLANVWGHQRV